MIIIVNLLANMDFMWACLSVGLVLFFLGRGNRLPRFRLIILNCFVFLLLFSALELTLAPRKFQSLKLVRSPNAIAPDDDLGYKAVANNIVEDKFFLADSFLFSSAYTIDSNGYRKSLQSEPRFPNEPCVLFYGGSFTFGHGLGDNQTLPSQVHKLSGLQVHNFGITGYRPHQALASLEAGLENHIQCQPKFVIFQTVLNHAMRVAGKVAWDQNGPKYELQKGEVVRTGNFSDQKVMPSSSNIFTSFFAKSHVLTKLNFIRQSFHLSDLLVAILDRLRDLTEERYPGSQFILIYWENPNLPYYSQMVKRKLQQKDFVMLPISTAIPQYLEDPAKYHLHAIDRHPNALATDLLAQYLYHQLLKE